MLPMLVADAAAVVEDEEPKEKAGVGVGAFVSLFSAGAALSFAPAAGAAAEAEAAPLLPAEVDAAVPGTGLPAKLKPPLGGVNVGWPGSNAGFAAAALPPLLLVAVGAGAPAKRNGVLATLGGEKTAGFCGALLLLLGLAAVLLLG